MDDAADNSMGMSEDSRNSLGGETPVEPPAEDSNSVPAPIKDDDVPDLPADSPLVNGDAENSENRKRSRSNSLERDMQNGQENKEVGGKRVKKEPKRRRVRPQHMNENDEEIWTALETIAPNMESPQLPDLEKFWRPVIDSPKDFQAWTSLLQYVDHENDVAAAREAYEQFLKRYPYCYGYWKKWADFEKKKAMKKDCEKVFEQGLAAIPLSVDLWLHYLNYCRVHHAAQESFVREQFEKALNICGLEFRSDRLWELYINWEIERDDLRRVFSVYDRLLAVPTQFHNTHWESFQDQINQNDPKELLALEEYEELKREIFRERKISTEAIADIKLTEEEIQAIRTKIRERRYLIRSQTEKDIAERWAFEEGIKRPYFHVKALERGQLRNWKNYLEFEMSRGNETRIRTLFERCLIACAPYEEYWVMYAQYLESKLADEPDNDELDLQLQDVYRRACTVHVYEKPTMYLMWAAYEERMGNFKKAERIFDLLEKACPRVDSLVVRRVNLARRQGQTERAVQLFRDSIDQAKKNQTSVTPLTLRASRFAQKVLLNDALAEEFVEQALEVEPRSSRLYLQLFDVRYQRRPLDVSRCVEVLDRAVKAKLDLEQRCKFAHRKVELLEDFSDDVSALTEVNEEYEKLVKQLQEERQLKNGLQQQTAAAATEETKSSTEEGSKKSAGKADSAAGNATAAASYDASYAAYGGQGYQGYGYPGWGGYPQSGYQYGSWGQGYYQQ